MTFLVSRFFYLKKNMYDVIKLFTYTVKSFLMWGYNCYLYNDYYIHCTCLSRFTHFIFGFTKYIISSLATHFNQTVNNSKIAH